MDSIRFTILDPNNKNGVWESVSSTEVRLKPNIRLKKEIVQGIAKDDFDEIWAILKVAYKEAHPNTFSKKVILIILTWGTGLLLLAAVGWRFYFNAQFRVYQDDQYKFSIKYPKTWKLIVHSKENVAVIFLRPKDTALDTLQENFNVTVQPLPEGLLTLAEFSDRIKAQMISVFGKNTKFVEYRPLRWGRYRGYKMSIEAFKPDNLRMVNAWVVRGNQSYILTFLGNINKYAKDSLVVNTMIRSFRLK